MIALLDGDVIAYRASIVQQHEIDWDGDGNTTTHVSPEGAAVTALEMVQTWTNRCGAKSAYVMLSGDQNFRKVILPTYKANRTAEKPLAYQAAVDALETGTDSVLIPKLEADDLIGIYGTDPRLNTVMVTIDKDLQSVPGRHWNPDKDPIRQIRTINARKADEYHLLQTMMGDKIDGYTGIPKVGEKTAHQILTLPRRLLRKTTPITKGKSAGKTKTTWIPGGDCSVWQSMLDHAERGGLTAEDLITQARVARILRYGEYDWETGHIKLWRP